MSPEPVEGSAVDSPAVDVLIPTFGRPTALAVTLAGVAAQTHRSLRVIVSNQDHAAFPDEVLAVAGVLRAQGRIVELAHHLPRRGMAEHRQSLLDRATAPYVLFVDDDVVLEPDLVARLVAAIARERCGFVGSALLGWSFVGDVRPAEQSIELWTGPVVPERVVPGSPAWERHRLHNAANLVHVARRLDPPRWPPRLYKVAWVGGCVLYDARVLREAGGFEFWRELPESHAGEDVLAQLRVMARAGGAGLIPSGAWHLELPTTVSDRRIDAPLALPIETPG
ncbi:MAG TPA: glycosyltransferase family A protein [Candidatus Limnocylindrales bacterium]|nr:glycosyltransferase family A protein [Candidatus Limnocylindrales bacterium]